MTAPAFPTYPKVRRSFGGFNYGLYLAVKALYNQVNNLTVIDPDEKIKLEALFNEAEKQIPQELKEVIEPEPEKEVPKEDEVKPVKESEHPKEEDPKPEKEEPKKEEHKRGRPSKKKV